MNREFLWLVVERYGVRGRLKEAVKSLYLRSEACVRIHGQNSDWFGIERGVRQGCTLSSWPFNLFLDNIVRGARESYQDGVQLEAFSDVCR